MEVLPISAEGRQIRFSEPDVASRLEERAGDIGRAIEIGTRTVADGLRQLASPDGWNISEVSASFGVALLAEGRLLITKASVGVTVEVTVKFVSDTP